MRLARLSFVLCFAACSGGEIDLGSTTKVGGGGGSAGAGAGGGGGSAPVAPLAKGSPWPKFRGDLQHDGRSRDVHATTTGGNLWKFPTAKGIFSSPVVGADGTVYVGSADRTFYALAPDGTKKWSVLTGEIIDSSALLDDRGRVYFGSGDGHLRALDAATGKPVWDFQADAPSTTGGLINWFEGNVGMGLDGTLYVPNDNFRLYAIDRDAGTAKWGAKMPDQTWSLPAIDPSTGDLLVGNNNLLAFLGPNTFRFSAKDGTSVWTAKTNGSIAASPLLTDDGTMIVGGFDGYVRAYDAVTGDAKWTFGTRDHLYASPAQLADGTIIQPSADGTVYALDPKTGAQVWAYDTLEAIRSSPAIDADGNIYFGSGEGRLFVLDSKGQQRWAIQLIDAERNDVNSSPALGKDAIFVGGESGEVFSVPSEYCLRPMAKSDAHCVTGPGEDLPSDGAHLFFTSQYGSPLVTAPTDVDANELFAFSLYVRKAGDTVLALVDSPSVSVTASPSIPLKVEVSGDRRFLTVMPEGPLKGDAAGNVTLSIKGNYVVNPDRKGLKFTGGAPGGAFDTTFTFHLRDATPSYPMAVPKMPGDPSSTFEIYRLAAPLPTILPSYNQIGFDSLHYLVGAVSGTPDHFVAWVVGAKLADGANTTVIDPETKALFPLDSTYANGLLDMQNQAGFNAEVMNATLSFDEFHLATRLLQDGTTQATPHLAVSTKCAGIQLYGPFLEVLGLCNAQTDLLSAYGAALLRPVGSGPAAAPSGVGTVALAYDSGKVTATYTGSSIKKSEHVLAILLVDATTGAPLSLDYGLKTTRTAGADGAVQTVTLDVTGAKAATGKLRAYAMVDTYPVGSGVVTLPLGSRPFG
jgi:outer membrane protein assembly factor BamB